LSKVPRFSTSHHEKLLRQKYSNFSELYHRTRKVVSVVFQPSLGKNNFNQVRSWAGLSTYIHCSMVHICCTDFSCLFGQAVAILESIKVGGHCEAKEKVGGAT